MYSSDKNRCLHAACATRPRTGGHAIKRTVCTLALPLLLFFCVLPAPYGVADTKHNVFVSILPQEYFVERIGGSRVTARALIEPGSSPATWEPAPRRLAELGKARLFFRIGAPFESSLIPKIGGMFRNLEIVDTREGITLRSMPAHHHHHDHDHDHGAEEKEDPAGSDPHIWLSPPLVRKQACTIADTLSRLWPEDSGYFRENRDAFLRDLDDLDARLKKILAPVQGKTFMVFHPSWGYFADTYGLRQLPVEIEGKDPGARQLARIIETARAEDIRVIFVQPQFSRAAADRIAESIGGKVLTADPLARNYIENLEAVARMITEHLSGGKQNKGDNQP
jgi:zinc transport system substrate-binding protein